MFNAVKVKNNIVQWIRDWFAHNGPNCNAIIGISGGKDSTIAAALCVEALGPDRVIGILMPNGLQPDITDSYQVIAHLNITHYICNISNAVGAIHTELQNNDIIPSSQATINLPARIRMSVLYAFSQSLNGRVVNTCNLSEDYIGYSTRWGDSVGDFSPLANLTTDEVVAIGDSLGLPYELVHKTPSDGLCGKTDEDNFGFTYAELNKYIRTGICEDQKVRATIDNLHNKNLFKLKPIPSFNYQPFYEENTI